MMSAIDQALDVLLPGGDGFPAASLSGAPDWLRGEDRFAGVVAAFEQILPSGFEQLSVELKAAALSAIETEQPEQFQGFIIAAYSAYYTRPAVLDVIERQCGYKARPPQPGGYSLDAFDPEILKVPASRPPSWRDPVAEVSR